jgi:NAD(P)-dependent dehydrogenase (short-subunit alcohol dehydrogenase family)
MEDLGDRVAVVIGGGSGIGRGIALGFATEGMHVVVADIDAASAEEVRGEIVGSGGRATAAEADGTDRQSLGRLAETTVAEHGAVHVLSTNVGVVADRPLTSASETDWAWIIEFNLLSAVRAVDVFLPHLRASGGSAHIVVTASLAALLAPPSVSGVHLGLYTATKHALLGYAESLRGVPPSIAAGRVAGHPARLTSRYVQSGCLNAILVSYATVPSDMSTIFGSL